MICYFRCTSCLDLFGTCCKPVGSQQQNALRCLWQSHGAACESACKSQWPKAGAMKAAIAAHNTPIFEICWVCWKMLKNSNLRCIKKWRSLELFQIFSQQSDSDSESGRGQWPGLAACVFVSKSLRLVEEIGYARNSGIGDEVEINALKLLNPFEFLLIQYLLQLWTAFVVCFLVGSASSI